MFKPSFKSPRRRFGAHASRGPSSSRGGPRRFSGGTGRGGGGGGRGRPRRFGKYIDPALFINKAVVTETEVFTPENAFSDFAIAPELKRAIGAKGYVTPTPIQDRAIPHILQGQDVVGIANTGTGKTAAFLIPLINKVLNDRDQSVLIMVPTRELALQINEELRGFSQGMRIFSATFVGGTSVYRDLQKLRLHTHFIIGTPGRLKDMLERNALDLSTMSSVVLDEADRMLDMGFVNDMRLILGKMSKDRHTLFFSATTTKEVQGMIKDFLVNPVMISVKTADTAEGIDQDVVHIDATLGKMDTLVQLLKEPGFDKVLIFGETKHGVEKLANELTRRGIRAESIHGNKTHGKRQSALRMFKESHAQVLVATDVAARGLDINGVSHVINYDIPHTYEDYVHRIGRTGRGGKKGKALTFLEKRSH